MKKFGPALVVTAAFIGPGTVTTASITGANFGFGLLWALLFSVIATYILQEMASRLGLVTGKGLADVMREHFRSPIQRKGAIILVVSAIAIGNSAYQGGNLTGAALGLSNVLPMDTTMFPALLGMVAAVVLFTGKQQFIERSLIGLVAVMSMVFVVTMFLTSPDWTAVLNGLVPSIPDGSVLSVIAIIGTTVVPYNLFLHASIVAKLKTRDVDLPAQLRNNRVDSALSIGAGGLITLAIMSCAASAFFATGNTLESGNIAQQLKPFLGDYAALFFGLGLAAAGLTSAITAPLAAAFAVTGIIGWKSDLKGAHFRVIWALILVCGVVIASLGIKPLAAILFAQAANGVLLPVIAVYLIWTTSRYNIMGKHRNSILTNGIGTAVVLLVTGLGLYKVATVF